MSRRRKGERDCGCRHDERRWVELCAGHKVETDARHAQAQIDYRAYRDYVARRDTAQELL